MRPLALSLSLLLVPMAPVEAASGWPETVRVFRMHRRGSSIPARIDVVPTELYVARVLASGAMPADRPMEALKAMALVVATRVTWLSRHPDGRMRWHGRRFSVTDGSHPRWCGSCDGGMLYRAIQPHSRQKRAVAAVLDALLRRPNGNLRKPQYSGRGYAVTGNRLPAMGASRLARRGYGWRRIIRVYFPKGHIEEAR